MIVEKKSSILGCRGEVPQPLDADHHNLCKYDSPEDSNYLKVRNVLHSFVAPLLSSNEANEETELEIMEKLSSFLTILGPPEDDLDFYFDRWMPGTCSWISSKESSFTEWIRNASSAQMLWLHGSPGTGKSVLASYLINHLKSLGNSCSYYFFRSGNRMQRNVGSFLRSIAYQIAQQHSHYRHQLLEMYNAGTQLQRNDGKLLWQKLFLSLQGQLETPTPIYIVIDALDESDSPQMLLSLLSSISASCPLRLIVISRPTHSISSGVNRFPEHFPVTRLSIESSSQDIPLFVESELDVMHADEGVKQRVIKHIIERASGSFLWVHLAVKEILNCHTQDEIEQSLRAIPSDMQHLYKRIEDTMAENLKASDQKLARAFLNWVGCSQRPLGIAELSGALEPEFGHILDLERTVNQICGNFLTIDRNSRVTFVHQTARDYLARLSTGHFAIDRAKANEDLFLRCMSCLCDSTLRAQLRKPSLPSLVPYGATSWQYHLSAVPHDSGAAFSALSAFLEDSAVLTWIQILALQKQLRTLVQASQSLAAFADRRRVYDASIAPNLRPLEALESVDLWATDFVKLVGKFGRNLVDLPDSIHKFIPQLCPKSSAIHRQFGRRGAFSVRVAGDANAAWDDSLAKLFVGADSEALSIVCAGRYFAILTSVNSIIVWDAETCQETRRLQPQDRIMVLCASHDGKLLASCGTRTTKVWELSTGQEVVSVPSPSDMRALHAIFEKNASVLLVSSDDRIVRTLHLNEPQLDWRNIDLQHLEDQMMPSGNASISPCSTAFSPDGTQIAMAFRGAPLSVWAIDDLHWVARCRRERGDQVSFDAQPWSPVDTIIWRPSSPDVIGIYMGGAIFRWNTTEDASQEINAAATTVTCSQDGELIASSDANGTVKIWKPHDFTLLYQLRYDYPVTALAIAPDNRRLYDLRGSFCNVWEPNTLIRLSDLERYGSEASSERASIAVSTTMSEAEVEMKEPVTAVAIGPYNHTYVTGNAEGSVILLQRFGDSQTELWSSPTFMPIEHLAWSVDGRHIALRDLGGKVIVQEIDPTKSSQPSREPLFSQVINTTNGPVQQIMLGPNSERVLIISPSSAKLFSVRQGSQIAEWRSENAKIAFRWITHPLHADRLLAIGVESAHTFTWEDLTSLSTLKLDLQRSKGRSNSTGKLEQIRRPSDPGLILHEAGTIVENVMYTQDKKHIMIESTHFTGVTGNVKGDRQLAIFAKSALEDLSTPITPRALPPALLDRYQLPLGILSGDKFVFLDNEHWICSWQLGLDDEARALKRYFFLPRDWLNAECLELCRILDNGVLLIPRQGEIASIKSDLGAQW